MFSFSTSLFVMLCFQEPWQCLKPKVLTVRLQLQLRRGRQPVSRVPQRTRNLLIVAYSSLLSHARVSIVRRGKSRCNSPTPYSYYHCQRMHASLSLFLCLGISHEPFTCLTKNSRAYAIQVGRKSAVLAASSRPLSTNRAQTPPPRLDSMTTLEQTLDNKLKWSTRFSL
ncbi:hypothetical protein BDW69DRAFT_177859, partial [Aspergillus filifer]